MSQPLSRQGDLERPEQATAWELRAAWARHQPVVCSLSPRCLIKRVEGIIEHVAVTGAFVVIDGWHIPTVDILAVHKQHYSQREAA